MSNNYYLRNPCQPHSNSSAHPYSQKRIAAESIYDKICVADDTYNSNKRSRKGGSNASHGGEIGFALGATILSCKQFLAIESGDVFVDAGGGRGHTAIVCKLIQPKARAISVEIDTERHEMAVDTVERIQWEETGKLGCWKKPELINQSFIDDSMDDIWKQPRLKIFFNNFGGLMMMTDEGLQFQLEEKLTNLCRPGTLIVSLDKMFMKNRMKKCVWKEEELQSILSDADLSWFSSSRTQLTMYKYTRQGCVIQKESHRNKPDPVWLGAAELGGTDWEDYYGKQTYPVKIVGAKRDKVHFIVEEPWLCSLNGKKTSFETEVEEHKKEKLTVIYEDGTFNAHVFFRYVHDVYFTLRDDEKYRKCFLKRWLCFFKEMSLLSEGANDHLKRKCSYARPTRFLISALVGLQSKAIYEFGAGKGVLFSLLVMSRHLNHYKHCCDVAVDSQKKFIRWCEFDEERDERKHLLKEGVVCYEKDQDYSVSSFTERFRKWKANVAKNIRAFGLTPELLFISWPNTDDEDLVNCIKGWYAAGGERLAVIYDPDDPEAFPPGSFLNELHENKWRLMENVLNFDEEGIKSFERHMPLSSWGYSHGEIFQASNYSYGLYIFERVN